jgi:hypothetical protein
MRTPRAEVRYAALFAALAAAATAALVAGGGESAGRISLPSATAASWQGLAGGRSHVAVDERVIVVLKTPSLAEHVAALGGSDDIESEKAWTKVVLSAQKILASRLALLGVVVHPDLSFARVLDGFSALVPVSVLPMVERDADVAGVYPVRIAYPASVTSAPAATGVGGAGGALASAGIDGRGVTVALLDTGVEARAPLLHGRVLPTVAVVGPGNEDHGTEMAGVIARAAPGASILPIRVAGEYARSDELIAGLDRAVDPNGDGDAHDAARIALVALAEPFGGFADGPESLAVAGARALDLLVVAPAGNDGPAGADYGDLAAPGGAPDALTVGALDTRPGTLASHVTVRAGLRTLLDTTMPLAGNSAPARTLGLEVARPRSGSSEQTAFFTRRGGSLVAGRAALVRAGSSPGPAAARAARAGASAVLVFGRGVTLPGGGLGVAAPVPIVSVPPRVAHAVVERLDAGLRVTVTIGPGRDLANPDGDRVAAFSSTGLAFDGSVKPDLVAPGVGVETVRGGRTVSVSGSSVAAAIVAGSAAVLAQARPALGADALDGLLVGSARTLPRDAVTAQGAGAVDVGAAAAGEVAASPPTLALGTSSAAGREVKAAFTLTNLSTRPLRIALGIRTQHEGAAIVRFKLRPSHVALAPGRSALVRIDALTASQAVGSGTADGAVVGSIDGGGTTRVPWAIAFASRPAELVHASLSTGSHALTVDAGSVTVSAGKLQVHPLARLDVVLRTRDGRAIGLLARVFDVLPGRYVFRLTGQTANGRPLAPGAYVATVVAYPTDGGPPMRRKLGFSVP